MVVMTSCCGARKFSNPKTVWSVVRMASSVYVPGVPRKAQLIFAALVTELSAATLGRYFLVSEYHEILQYDALQCVERAILAWSWEDK
jgi:hypothetical protein